MYALLLSAFFAADSKPIPVQKVWLDPDDYEGKVIAVTGWARYFHEKDHSLLFLHENQRIGIVVLTDPDSIAAARTLPKEKTGLGSVRRIDVRAKCQGTKGRNFVWFADGKILKIHPAD